MNPDELHRRVAHLGELARVAGERLAALEREVAGLQSVIGELALPANADDQRGVPNPTTDSQVAQEVLSK